MEEQEKRYFIEDVGVYEVHGDSEKEIFETIKDFHQNGYEAQPGLKLRHTETFVQDENGNTLSKFWDWLEKERNE